MTKRRDIEIETAIGLDHTVDATGVRGSKRGSTAYSRMGNQLYQSSLGLKPSPCCARAMVIRAICPQMISKAPSYFVIQCGKCRRSYDRAPDKADLVERWGAKP